MNNKIIVLISLIFFLSFSTSTYSQDADFGNNLSDSCKKEVESDLDLSSGCRGELQNELNKIREEIDNEINVLSKIQADRTITERDLDVLRANIRKELLGIRAREIKIFEAQSEIKKTKSEITLISDDISDKRRILSRIIQNINEIEEKGLTYILLSEQSISDFFVRINDYQSLQEEIDKSFQELNILKKRLESEQDNLIKNKNEEEFLVQVQKERAEEIKQDEQKKEGLLNQQLSQERNKEAEIADKQSTAAQIRNALFKLRDSGPIPFGEALEYAQNAERETGVRAAFILGVITQETRLGANVGTGKWSVDMHPTRDRPIFLAITEELGINPNEAPVSKKPGYGWGGAMGPAQFIPSTWVCFGGFVNTRTNSCNRPKNMTVAEFSNGPWEYRASKDKIRKVLKTNAVSNPWNPEVAFMASALLLRENGAAKGGYNNEHLAARIYFAGPVGARNPAYYFYGDGVMRFTANYARQIALLN